MKKGLKELLKENINNYVIVNGGASQYLWFAVPNGKNCEVIYTFHLHYTGNLQYYVREAVMDSYGRHYKDDTIKEMPIDSESSLYRLVKSNIKKGVEKWWC